MEALAAVTQLQARLPFTMDEDEKREAQGALEDLSDEARFYGSAQWDRPANAPYQVVNLVLKAAARHMKNYEGYVVSAAGDERVGWSDKRSNPDEAGSATFSPLERERLGEIGGSRRSTFYSANMFTSVRPGSAAAYQPVPSADGGKPFPYPEAW